MSLVPTSEARQQRYSRCAIHIDFNTKSRRTRATLAAWAKNRPVYEKEVQRAVNVSGAKWHESPKKKLSLCAGRVPSHVEIEHGIVA